jgi:hypothetical protein
VGVGVGIGVGVPFGIGVYVGFAVGIMVISFSSEVELPQPIKHIDRSMMRKMLHLFIMILLKSTMDKFYSLYIVQCNGTNISFY